MFCNKCGGYTRVGKRHKCPPQWNAIYGGEYCDAYGWSAEDAALWLAEKHWSDWGHPDEMEICIRDPETGDWIVFLVEVDVSPEFYAARHQ